MAGGKIVAIELIADPDRLHRLDLTIFRADTLVRRTDRPRVAGVAPAFALVASVSGTPLHTLAADEQQERHAARQGGCVHRHDAGAPRVPTGWI
jgi:hypothetical protein